MRIVARWVVVPLLAAPALSWAGSASTSLSVTASVSNNCTISTAALAFGAYDPIVTNASTALDGTGTVTIACTKGASTTIGLDTGTHSGNASGTTRAMSDGAGSPSYLSYELYQNSSRTTVWSNSGGGLYTPAAAPSKAARSSTVYVRVPSGQEAIAWIISDTIQASDLLCLVVR